ncbi:ABC transporter substrate-binding protein [Cytobacillus kochii]|uniref:ABC transporter substrate-binding protein n=1 Tax=Cytobacillus kochii TaxID=859143 RepID=UPI002786299E|nr:ABC transporter substrate-binding protein [Cytobacillus kochii]MDQ0187948.1 putative ABC transport system substrate-binding protein [Cytobacillus kochii]MED1606298.1 ABC transporter substrate-binding protein [Cytobacillus kochii]
MRKLLAGLIGSSMLLLGACGSSGADEASGREGNEKVQEVVKIGITQIVEHPSLDAAREGFIAALKDAGYEEGKNLELDYQNAQGDANNNMSIAQNLVNDDNDLILAIATASAQSVVQSTKDIPILFTGITDPLSADLVKDLDNPGENVTGTSDTHPDAIKNTIASIKKFVPEAKTVGIIYNDGEANSIVNVENAKKALEENGLEYALTAISTSSEVKQAAESLVDRSDVFYIPKDNTVVSALESVITVANKEKIPTFVGESDSVERGTFSSYGFEYHDLGYKTGEMAIEILNGKNPGDIPVGFPDNLELIVNKSAAEKQGVELTDELLEGAKVIGE